MLELQNHNISKLTGTFVNKSLEEQFQQSYLIRSKGWLRKTALIMGILFFSFIIYDIAANKSIYPLSVIFISRLTFLFLSLHLFFRTDHVLKSSAFLKITFYELAMVIIFFIIIASHEDPHFLIQAFAVNVIILCIFFLVPNLLYYKVILSSFMLLGFLLIGIVKFHPYNLEVISVLVYLSLTIFYAAISSYSLDKYMRLDFANKQYFIELSSKDPLTNIFNRQKFNEALKNEMTFVRRYGNTFSLIIFDIDHFKQFNDTQGHIFGDKVIIHLANLVKDSIREVDVFARWGGEEFVILLPQTDCDEASSLAERLRKIIYKESLKHNMNLTCSFGVTSFSDKDNEDSIMIRADIALYKAKESGRNKVVTEYSPKTFSA